MSTTFTSTITILLLFMISNISSEVSTSPCTIEITGLESDLTSGEMRPFVFFFDQNEMDRILGNTNWNGDTFQVYLVRDNIRIRTMQIQRNPPNTPTGQGRGRIASATPMAGDWQVGDVFAIIDEELVCQPSDDLECAQFTCQSVDGSIAQNGAQRRILDVAPAGAQCNFDIDQVDTILDNTAWSNEVFPIYNQRTMTIRYARLFRYPNGGSVPTMNRGYLEILTTDRPGGQPMSGDWEVDDELSFIGQSTVCDPDCDNDYPLFDAFLDECSEQYAADRSNIQQQLDKLTTYIIGLGIKTKILFKLLSRCDCGSSDSSDSSDDSSSGESRAQLSTLEGLDIINAFLDIIANDMSLNEMGEMGKLLNVIQQEIQMND